MSVKSSFAGELESALSLAVRHRVTQIGKEEADAAAERVRKRVADEMDAMALRLLSEYSVIDQGTHIRIEVRKPEKRA